jgi:hypothetical protein
MTATMTEFVLTFCVVFAVLYVVIRFDEWWQDRRPDTHEEPPSRLDLLDNPPAGRHPDPLPPGVGSAGRPAGATIDDPWMP